MPSSALNANEGDNKGCCCGNRIKSRNKFACTSKEGKSHCPCLKRGRFCNRNLCRCRYRGNVERKDAENKTRSCRCGEGNKGKDAEKVACKDVNGKRRTECPCFAAALGCKGCKCYNCQNSFGMNTVSTPAKETGQQGKRKSVLSTSPSIKRRRGTENIEKGGSQLESCLLDMTESFLLSSNLTSTKENICILYNYVIENASPKHKALNLSKKSLAQVSGKLEYKKRRAEALWRLASGRSENE